MHRSSSTNTAVLAYTSALEGAEIVKVAGW